MALPNYPIVNAGLYYVSGLQLSYSTSTQLVMQPGQARDSTNVNDIFVSAPVTINGLQVGKVNGVDLAPLAAKTMYAVYAIGSSTSVSTSNDELGGGDLGPSAPANPFPGGGLLSLASNPQPYLPLGYDMVRRVGWVATDASAHFLSFWQYDADDQVRWYYYDAAVVVAAAAGAGPTAVPLAVGVGVSADIPAVPPLATQVLLDVVLSGAGTARFFPYGSSSSAGIVRFSAAGASQPGAVQVPTELNVAAPTVQVAVSAGTAQLSVIGYVDYL